MADRFMDDYSLRLIKISLGLVQQVECFSFEYNRRKVRTKP